MIKKLSNWRINGKKVIWFEFTYHYWNSKDDQQVTVYKFEGNRRSIADYYCVNNMSWDGCDTMQLISIRLIFPKLDKRHWHTRKVYK